MSFLLLVDKHFVAVIVWPGYSSWKTCTFAHNNILHTAVPQSYCTQKVAWCSVEDKSNTCMCSRELDSHSSRAFVHNLG